MKRNRVKIECKQCRVSIEVTPSVLKGGRKFCSTSCSNLYSWSLIDYRNKLKNAHKGRKPNDALNIWRLNGGKHKSRIGNKPWNKGLKLPQFSGPLSPHWITDRSLLAKKQERNDSVYKIWRTSVWERDSFKCRISNSTCFGRLEAHHILPWKDYPELRYEINNGITLCHAHHPKKRAEEAELIPVFQELVSVTVN